MVGVGLRDDEARVFAAVCAAESVELVSCPREALHGAGPMFGRLFLDTLLPSSADQLLYLDGDTQVLGPLDPLFDTAVPDGMLLAARDPMVMLRHLGALWRLRTEWSFGRSRIPDERRDGYLNSGMLRLSAKMLATVRSRVLGLRCSGEKFPFGDQDLLNHALSPDEVQIVSLRWNYPGFMLGTPFEELVAPVVVHFMSNPRPWQVAYAPWGERFSSSYDGFVDSYPEVAPYRCGLGGVDRVKYPVIQAVKLATELPSYRTQRALAVARRLECAVAGRCAADPH